MIAKKWFLTTAVMRRVEIAPGVRVLIGIEGNWKRMNKERRAKVTAINAILDSMNIALEASAAEEEP